MGSPPDMNIVKVLEDVFDKQLGPVNVYIVEQTIMDMGQTRHTFSQDDVEPFLSHIKREYSKVLGHKVDVLEADIRKALIE